MAFPPLFLSSARHYFSTVGVLVRSRTSALSLPRAVHTAATETAAWAECRDIQAADFGKLGVSELRALFAAQQPLVVRGYASPWPAATAWRDLDNLAARARGNVDLGPPDEPSDGTASSQPLLVPVEIGGIEACGLRVPVCNCPGLTTHAMQHRVIHGCLDRESECRFPRPPALLQQVQGLAAACWHPERVSCSNSTCRRVAGVVRRHRCSAAPRQHLWSGGRLRCQLVGWQLWH